MAGAPTASTMGDTPNLSKGRYRSEIDGLRAFAVVAVIINHFNKDLLPGGYLGVDIFFVISGYVITSSLSRRKSKNFLEFLAGFYERRIKRLVPALVAFVLITSLLISLINPEPQLQLSLGIKSLFGLSNIDLYMRSTNYFAQSTQLNPFTHTWSLGVEEQFYLLFPLLIWFSGFGRQTQNGARNLFLLIGTLTIISLAAFVNLYQTNQPAAYFLMPSRFWEMAAGCLVFIGLQKSAKIEGILEEVPPLLVVSLMACIMFLNISLAVYATTAIVLLTTVLLACLKRGTVAFAVFSNNKIRYIGLISYSLYLWHWGVLSISRWTIGIHWWSIPLQVALMLASSILSYTYLERPIRFLTPNPSRKLVVIITFILLSLSYLVISALRSRLSENIFLGKKTYEEVPHLMSGKELRKNCSRIDVKVSDIFKYCMFYKQNTRNTLWLVGDSHAEALQISADIAAKELRFNLFAYFYGATAFPPVNYYRIDDMQLPKAIAFMNSIYIEILSKMHRGDVVLISMRLPYHFGPDSYEFPAWMFRFYNKAGHYEQRPNKNFYFDEWSQRLEQFLRLAEQKGVKIVLFNATPEFAAAKNMDCKENNAYWFNRLKGKDCSIPKIHFIGSSGEYSAIFKRLDVLKAANSNLFIFNTFELFCPGYACKYSTDGLQPLYRDDDHISNFAAKDLVAPALTLFLRNQVLYRAPL